MQEDGTIEPVQFADWAAPIVPIVKDDKSIRICGDYKVTVNQAAKLDNYPIPKAEDLFATLIKWWREIHQAGHESSISSNLIGG